jgi:hypothetical protein
MIWRRSAKNISTALASVKRSPIKEDRWDCFVERPGMQAPVKGMIFLTGLATDEVPDVNGMGFVKNRPGSRLFNGGRFWGLQARIFWF